MNGKSGDVGAKEERRTNFSLRFLRVKRAFLVDSAAFLGPETLTQACVSHGRRFDTPFVAFLSTQFRPCPSRQPDVRASGPSCRSSRFRLEIVDDVNGTGG